MQNEDLLCIQKIQNKMLRFINNVSLKEHKTTESLLEKTKMLSVNRINAQTKITEVWKALNNLYFHIFTSCINTRHISYVFFIPLQSQSTLTKSPGCQPLPI